VEKIHSLADMAGPMTLNAHIWRVMWHDMTHSYDHFFLFSHLKFQLKTPKTLFTILCHLDNKRITLANDSLKAQEHQCCRSHRPHIGHITHSIEGRNSVKLGPFFYYENLVLFNKLGKSEIIHRTKGKGKNTE
jgi:hypothetical protein